MGCAAGSWTGATSTDWNTASNWCSTTVPTSSTNVTIAAGANQPVISSASVCNNITINSGATVTLSGANALSVSGTFTNNGSFSTAGGTLNVTGAFSNTGSFNGGTGIVNVTSSFSNTGTFTPATGTVNFNGSTQTITGNYTLFYNVIIGGTGQKSITTANFAVGNIVSMEATGTINAVPFYGIDATLQYNTATARTVGVEMISPFVALGGIIIKNTGIITFSGNKVLTSCPLTIQEGATLANGSFTIGSPSSLNLVCGGLTAGSTLSGSGAITLGGDVNVTNAGHGSSGALISCPVALTDGLNRTLTVADDGTSATDLTISGVISTTGGLTKAGAGTLLLSAANNYSGLTIVNTGSLKLGVSSSSASTGPLGAASTGTTVSTGAVLDVNGFSLTSSAAEPLTLNGTGISGGGALANSGAAATYSGLVSLGSSSSISGGTGTIAISNAGTITGTTFGLTLGGSAGGSLTSIIGTTSGTVTKNGTGTWTLSGTNTFTGGTTLSAGTLNINNSNALGNTAGTFTITGGTIGNTSGGAITTNSYPLALNGDFAFTAANNLNLGTGAVTLSGDRTFTATSGTLTLGGVINDNTKSLTKSGAGTLNFGASAVTLKSLTISAGTLTSTSGNLSLAGDFTNNSTFTHNSGTVILNGTVAQAIGGSTTTGFNNLSITNTAAPVAINTNENITGTLGIGAGALLTPAAAVVLNNAALSGTISGSGTIQVTRTAATADYSNQYRFTTNTLGSMTIDYAGAGAQNVNTIGYGNLKLSNSGTKTFAGSTTVTGNLAISGTAVASLGNVNSFSASLTLGGLGQPSGSFGSSAATGATFKNVQYFGNSGTGVLNVSGGTCTAGVWLGTNSTDWNDANNWCGGVPSSSTDVIIASGPTNQPVIGSSGGSCRNLSINSGASLTVSGTNTLTVSGNFSNSGTFTSNSGTVSFNASTTQTLASGGSAFYNTNHSGSGTLQLTNSALTVNNSFNNSGGIFDMNGQSLTVGDLQGSGNVTTGITGYVTLTAGGDNASTTFSGAILTGGGNVSVTKNGTGVWTLTGTNTYTGNTFVNVGTLKLGNTAALGTSLGGTIIATGAVLDLNGVTLSTAEPLSLYGTGISSAGALLNTGSAASYSGAITLGSAASIGTTGDITLPGIISGAYALTKVGNGTLTLSGSNSYSGLTTIGAGTLKLGASGDATNTPLGTSASGTSVNTGAVLDLNGYSLGTSEALTLNGTGITNGGALINSGAAAIYNGSITMGSSASINTAANITLGTGGISGGFDLTKIGSGTLNLGSGTATLGSLNINAGTLVGTSGTLNLSGSLLNSGAFTHNSGTVVFNGSTAVTISGTSCTFNNLTITDNAGVTASSNETVNGILNLQGTNASSTKGSLDMGSNTLTMGASATTTGTGDVTGIVSRSSFVTGTPYSFGNQFTTLNFTGTAPTGSISAKIVLTVTPWDASLILRYYDFIESVSNSSTNATLNLHYLDGELNGATASNLYLYDYDLPTGPKEFQGRSNYNATDRWVGLGNLTMSYVAPAASFDGTNDKRWSLGTSVNPNLHTWTGHTDTDWNKTDNWTGGVPDQNSDVVIPATTRHPILPTSTTVNSITIQTNGVLEGGTGTLTLLGGSGAWLNNGTFNCGTSNVHFHNPAATYADPTNFYDVTIDDGAKVTLGTGSTMRIAHNLSLSASGVLDAGSNECTVEYNGTTAQTIVNPNGSTAGYHNLIVSGGGVKTWPTDKIYIRGDFTNNNSSSETLSNVEFNGPTNMAQNIGGTYSTSFTSLTVNNSYGLNLNTDENITGTLAFTNGKITTGAHTLALGSSGSAATVTGSGDGKFVDGNERKYIPSTPGYTSTVELGDATHYTPVTVTFNGTPAGTGYIDVSSSVAAPPLASGLSQSQYINREWTVTNHGLTGFTSYNVTFTYINPDDGVGSPTPSTLLARQSNDGNTWSRTTLSGAPTATTATLTGLTTFGTFALGENGCTSTSYVWLGSTSTDWNDGSNWCNNVVPDATVDVTIPSGPANQPVIGSAGGSCKNITIDPGASLTITGSYGLAVYGNWANSGTFTPNSSTVTLGGSSAQDISGNCNFYSLTIANTDAVVTTSANLTIAGTVTVNSGADLEPGAIYTIGGAGTLTGNGTAGVTNITSPADFATQYTLTKVLTNLTVNYDGAGNQTINAFNYNSLTLGSNGTRTVTFAGTGTIGVAGAFISGSANVFAVSGSTVNLNGSSAQTITGSVSFNNLTISNAAGVTASSNLSVSGVLNLSAANPSTTKGSLDMGTNTLEMGLTGTTTGTGDVTGIIKRTGAISAGPAYSFGSQFTTLEFIGFTTSRPTWISCQVVLGNAPSWKTTGVKRYYSFAKDTGSDRVKAKFRYLSSELNSLPESSLVLWDANNGGGGTWTSVEPQGKSGNNLSDHWVELDGMSIIYIAPSSVLNDKQWGLNSAESGPIKWTGEGAFPGDWSLPGNWDGGIPTASDDVVIPAGLSYPYPYRLMNSEIQAIAKTITIESGASVSVDTYNITLAGEGNVWVNNGSFTRGSGTVIFNGSGLGQTIGGSSATTFNNLTLNTPNGLSLSGVEATVNGILTFTSGKITTGDNDFALGTSATVTGGGTGWVIGNFEWNLPNTGSLSKTFYVGDATNYTPVLLDLHTLSGTPGTLTVKTTEGQHPNISTSGLNYSKDINRYWTLTADGVSVTNYDATFTFVAGDIRGSAATSGLIGKEYSSGWISPVTGANTSTTTKVTGLTTYGDFVLGEAQSLDHFTLSLSDPQVNGLAFTGSNILTAKDVSGNTITGFDASANNVTISTSLSGAISGLPGGSTLTAAGDFILGIADLTSHGLTYTGTSGSGTFTATSATKTGSSNSIVVGPGAANAVNSMLTPTSSTITADGVSTKVLTVQARDISNNNLVTGGSTVTITKSSGTGTINSVTDNGNGTYTAAVISPAAAGSGTFVASLGGTDVRSGSGTQTTSTVNYVAASAASKLQILMPGETPAPGTVSGKTGTPTPQTAGTSFNIIVNAVDANWNIVSSNTHTIAITSSDGAATLPSNAALTGGTSTFSITLNTASVSGKTITATDQDASPLTPNTSSSVEVNPGALNNFLVERASGGDIPGQTAGTAFAIRITARDSQNNTCTSFTGTVSVSSNGTLSSGSGTTSAFTAGVLSSYSVTVSNTGNFAITVNNGGIENSSISFSVNAGQLNNFLVEESAGGNISSQIAGTAFTIKITARDANNNTCLLFTGTANITSSGTLSSGSGATGSFTSGVLSSHAVTISNIGTFTITATNGSTGSSNSFAVDHGQLSLVSSGGNWSNPEIWNNNKVPIATDNVSITDKTVIVDINSAVCNDLAVTGSGVLTISGSGVITVSGTLTNSAGTGGLVILSTSDASGTTGALRNDNSNVLATVQRWMKGDIWHLVSPTATAVTTPTIADFTSDQGNLIAYAGSVYGLAPYNETDDSWTYYLQPTPSGTFSTPGKGYEVLRGPTAADGTGTHGTDGIVSFKGTLTSGNVTSPLVKSHNGWNLIGNPYPCALDIEKFVADAGNISSINPSYLAIYVRDLSPEGILSGGYIPVNNLSGLLLSSGEGFFVKAAAAGSVNFKTTMKSSAPAAFRAGEIGYPDVTLSAQSGTQTLNTSVKYISGMSAGLDPGWDAGLFNGGTSGFSLFTRLVQDNGVDFAIQVLPDNNYENLIVPVGLVASKGSTINFKATATNLPSNMRVFLEDKVIGTSTRLDDGSVYTITLGAESQGAGRFYLHTVSFVSAAPTDQINEVKVIPLPQNDMIRLAGNISLPAIALVYDMTGRLITEKVLTATDQNDIPLVNASNGVYMLKIDSKKTAVTKKVVWIKN